MKNVFLTILIMLFVLPAFTPWLSYGAVHSLHDHQVMHHGAQIHSHGNEAHDHHAESDPIYFDAVTYFSNYLHVDLQSPEQTFLKTIALDTYDIDYSVTTAIKPMPRYELAFVQSRAPPDTRRFRPDKTPLYISTQRLRI